MRKNSNNFLKIIIFCLCSTTLTLALRFDINDPITVDTDVILVGKPAILKCNYMKFRTENVREISWYIAYDGFKSKIFNYLVTKGKKEESIYSFVKTDSNSATENDLTITMREFRKSPMTIGCEVEVIRDDNYGRINYSKKKGEVNVTVVDTQGQSLSLKHGKWNSYGSGSRQAKVGQPLIVSCISKGSGSQTPNLTLTINDQPWNSYLYNGQVRPISSNRNGEKIIEGEIPSVNDRMFNSGVIKIKCESKYDDFVLKNEELNLGKELTVYDNNNPSRHSQRPGYNPGFNPGGNNGIGQLPRDSRVYDNEIIHSRLLDLLDPAKHMHPGIPYDFYDGYILMVADNVDDDINNVNNNGYGGHRGNSRPVTTHLYGHLANEIIRDLQSSYGSFQTISNKKYMIKMNPVDILNQLGTHGYRVIGFTAESDKKMVWTLELRDFEQAHPQKQQQHQHNNRWT